PLRHDVDLVRLRADVESDVGHSTAGLAITRLLAAESIREIECCQTRTRKSSALGFISGLCDCDIARATKLGNPAGRIATDMAIGKRRPGLRCLHLADDLARETRCDLSARRHAAVLANCRRSRSFNRDHVRRFCSAKEKSLFSHRMVLVFDYARAGARLYQSWRPSSRRPVHLFAGGRSL